MEKYIEPVERVYLYGDGKGYVELWSSEKINLNYESRVYAITKIASLSYGRDYVNNPEVLYWNLWRWKHLSVFEFVRGFTGEMRDSLRHNPDLPTIEKMAGSEDDLKNILEAYKSTIALFKLQVPQFVRDHFVRHRCFSFLVMSRRHTPSKRVPFDFYLPKNLPNESSKQISNFYQRSVEVYNSLIDAGVRPEEARIVIPVGVYTQFFMLGEDVCLKNFFNLRLHKTTQYETRIAAQAMYDLLERHQNKLYQKIRRNEDD